MSGTGETPDLRGLAALLHWQAEMGADEAVLDEPLDRLAAPAEEAGRPGMAFPPASIPPTTAATSVAAPAAASPHARAAACATLEDVHAALDAMTDFPLRRTATHTVHTDGHPKARVVLVGEAPGREEDLQGKPFVGRSGRLLDRMLAAIGLSRAAADPARAVLITNVVFWRPPGNRKPTEAEVTWCMPWLVRTIEIVAPQVIVCLGATPTQRLTGRTQGILRLRGTWLECEVGSRRIPLLPTLHPAYLLRQPLQKRLAWRDMLALRKRLVELGLLTPQEATGRPPTLTR